MKTVDLYTDGACSGNPGKGGYAAILIYGDKEKIITGSEPMTTNNRMELMGPIEGLKALKEKCNVNLYTDSAYVSNMFLQGWIYSWKNKGWRKKDGEIKNLELVKELYELTLVHSVTWIKVKGHSDNEYNNRCDALAVESYKRLDKDS